MTSTALSRRAEARLLALAVLLWLLLCFTAACSPAPMQRGGSATVTLARGPRLFVRADDLVLSLPALRTAQAAWRDGWRARREIALCVTAFDVVEHYALVYQLGPANVSRADSLAIWGREDEDLCPAGQPVLHSHVVRNDWFLIPSPVDSETARHSSAPFQVLMSGETVFRLFGWHSLRDSIP